MGRVSGKVPDHENKEGIWNKKKKRKVISETFQQQNQPENWKEKEKLDPEET
jgi:hypothetical protein